MKRLIRFLVLSFIIFQSATAQSLVTAEIQKNSSLTINGSTNILSFKIYQDGDKLCKNKFTVATTQNQNKITVTQNQLSVIVKNFVSTNVMALRDFFKLLKSDMSPTLQVQLSSLDLHPINQNGKVYNGQAIVNITITGKTKQYSVPISFNNNGNVYIVDGCKKMSIRDFGLTPETKMMGMIKVSEWIDVDFHIICKISSNRDVAEL